MPYWAIAVACGPNINNPSVDPAHHARALEALKQAQDPQRRASAVERALIEAQAKRFSDPQPTDRSPLDRAYAEAMREVFKAYPNDSEVGVLFAEALMDLRPWDLWTPEGKPREGTHEALATLEAVLNYAPNHPQALHLMIHAIEASPNPKQGLEAANRLRNLQPGLGHMVHMPSHIDVRIGHWAEAKQANLRAIAADRAYRKRAGKLDSYRGYISHNYHMLVFAAMMRGEGRLAIKVMDEGVAIIPADWAKENASWTDGFMGMPTEVRKRFGRWQEVLAAPEPPVWFPLARTLRLGARGVALAALGRVEEAKAEQVAFESLRKTLPPDASYGLNSAAKILEIDGHLLEGEVRLAEGKLDASVEALLKAVAAEDQLRYSEPPDWLQPTRHTLGAVLVKAGRFSEAEATYRDDLKNNPENGWALFGLAQALEGQGRKAEAQGVQRRFRRAWKTADKDFQLGASCLCVDVK